MRRQRPPHGDLGAIVLGLAALGLECLVTAVFWFGQPGFILTLALHAAASAAIVLATQSAPPRERWFVAIATTAAGPAGAFCGLLAALLTGPFAARATPFEAWHRQLFAEDAAGPAPEAHLQAQPPSKSLVAFADILRSGSLAQRLRAVAVMADAFRPAFAPALRLALENDEPAVRVQAATAVAQLDRRFSERVRRAEAKAADGADAAAFRAAGEAQADFALSGIAEPERATASAARAEAWYRAALAHAPHDVQALAGLGRVLLHQGRAAEAALCLERAIGAGLHRHETIEAYAGALLASGAYGKLRSESRRLLPAVSTEGRPRTPLGDAMGLWARAASHA